MLDCQLYFFINAYSSLILILQLLLSRYQTDSIVIQANNCSLQVHGYTVNGVINMKPGRPVAFGHVDNTVFMGLPGNPVSVFVTFLVFARPLILKMQGADKYLPDELPIRSGFEWKGFNRQEYLRARINHDESGAYAEVYPHQGSGVLSSSSWADGLVIVEPGKAINTGDVVKYIPFQGLI